VRYAVLDLDDTLVATAEASFAAWVAATGGLGLEPPSRDAFVAGYRDLTFGQCVTRWYGTAVDFAEFSARYWDAVRYGPIGDVPALLRGLRARGIRAGIVTNSTGPEALRKLASAGIAAAAFDFVAGRPEGGSGEPPAKDLGRILGDRRIDPAAAVHVSDNPADFAPSVDAGLPFRGVRTGVYTAADFTAAGVPPADVHPDVHAALRT
jgi:phosphoglycolate phosphatase-like HAD superfamily hydrolase